MFDVLKPIIEKIGIEKLIINFIVTLGIVLIYLRVIKNFKQAKNRKQFKKKEVKSIVETVSMSRIFLVMLYCCSNWYWKI